MDTKGIKPPRAPQTANRWVWIVLGAILIIFILGRLFSSATDDGFAVGDKIGLVRIEGPIFSSRSYVNQIDKLLERSDVKALLVRVESPGGSVAPSQEIYQKLRSARDDKPVVISMGSVAASGGYYLALGGSRIVANPGSITGSIGVIMEYPVAAELLEKVGLSLETVKSGRLKDSGSPSREPTDADRQYFQSVVDDLHRQFVAAVAQERGLELSEAERLATGQVYTGRQALAESLIDSLGTFEDALNLAADLGNVSGKPKTVQIKSGRLSLLDLLLGEEEPLGKTWFDIMPVYRWRGEWND